MQALVRGAGARAAGAGLLVHACMSLGSMRGHLVVIAVEVIGDLCRQPDSSGDEVVWQGMSLAPRCSRQCTGSLMEVRRM